MSAVVPSAFFISHLYHWTQGR